MAEIVSSCLLGGVLPLASGWLRGRLAWRTVPTPGWALPLFFEMRRLAFGAVGPSMATYSFARPVHRRAAVPFLWKRLSAVPGPVVAQQRPSTLVSQLVESPARGAAKISSH